MIYWLAGLVFAIAFLNWLLSAWPILVMLIVVTALVRSAR